MNVSRWPNFGPKVGLLGIVLVGIVAVSCSSHGPAHLPVSGMYNRSTSRIEVSRIVVQDAARREKVHQTYEKLAQLGESFQAGRSAQINELVRLSRKHPLDDAAISARIEELKQEQRQAYAEYVDLQLRLRELVTEEEFNKLGKFD